MKAVVTAGAGFIGSTLFEGCSATASTAAHVSEALRIGDTQRSVLASAVPPRPSDTPRTSLTDGLAATRTRTRARLLTQESAPPRRTAADVESTLYRTPALYGYRRRATLVVCGIAVVEFLLLVALVAIVVERPSLLGLAGRTHPAAVARHRTSEPARSVSRAHREPARPIKVLPRDRVKIIVLNGNGINGAAGRAADGLHRMGYLIAGTGNASRMNYARSLVLYRPGYRVEALRLARELRVKIVGPIDGMPVRTLRGGELAVVLGG